MGKLRVIRKAIGRLMWHLFTGMALAGACMPGGHAGYDAVMRLRDEGPDPSPEPVRDEALAGIAAIEVFLAEQAPRDDYRHSR